MTQDPKEKILKEFDYFWIQQKPTLHKRNIRDFFSRALSQIEAETVKRVGENVEKQPIPISKNWDNQTPKERKEFYAGAERFKANILSLLKPQEEKQD